MSYADDFLIDDRTLIEFVAYEVGGRSNQFYAPFKCLMVRLGAFKAW